MCGILGIVSPAGRAVSLRDDAVAFMRDTLAHRGPDHAGLWRNTSGNVTLAHRRLSILDPAPHSNQPFLLEMNSGQGIDPCALTYNGELYNDHDVRSLLAADGVRFRTSCDTETITHACARWWEDGPQRTLAKLRGMYAFGFYQPSEQTLLLARDPLGVKPLYYAHVQTPTGIELVFASEVNAILAHPHMQVEPDLTMVSSYMTTIRTVLAGRTMYAGISALPAGCFATVDLHDEQLAVDVKPHWQSSTLDPSISAAAAVARTHEAVRQSTTLHLRADVPTCALLSGGIDSTITATIASAHVDQLNTYCAGDPSAPSTDDAPTDLHMAERAAAHIGTNHTPVHITEDLFRQRWPEMVGQLGVPMSTPNEVAIHAVARRLRADGYAVTLSGEGADELFAGYELPIALCMQHMQAAQSPTAGMFDANPMASLSPGRFMLRSAAWISPELKPQVLNNDYWQGIEGDYWLDSVYDHIFEHASNEAQSTGLDAYVRTLRMINLTGLLQRLDTATMLANVEGRTPFADAHVASLAESLPMCERFVAGEASTNTAARTKIALRQAFANTIPQAIVQRPKASFPVPFQKWVAPEAHRLMESNLLSQLCDRGALEAITSAPEQHWNLAWPLLNLAIWGERWD